MDDLSEKISEILGSEEGMKQVSEMAQMLGLDISQLNSAPGEGKKDEIPPKKEKSDQAAFDGINIETLLKVQKLMNQMNGNNNDVALLDALKPYVNPKRYQKIEDAKKIMSLMQLIPLINKGE